MYEILLRKLKLVSTIFIFAIKIKRSKNYQKSFLFCKKIPFCPWDFIKFLYLTLSLFLPFLAIVDFIEEVDWW